MRISLAEQLPAEHVWLLVEIGSLAARTGLPAYLVGGPVRDAVLGRPSHDMDVTVEGDAQVLARLLAEALGASLTLHERFGTAVVELADWHIDVVTARRETYPSPGALPVVEAADLAADLQRRDFTYNAMAVRLDHDQGLLVDPHGGLADLRARITRGLYERTFIDDPTRIIRAARYVARFEAPLAPETAQWLQAAVQDGVEATVTGQRMWGELSRLLAGPGMPEAVGLLQEWGLAARLGLASASQDDLRLLERAAEALSATGTDVARAALGLLAGPRLPRLMEYFGLSAAEVPWPPDLEMPPPGFAGGSNSALYEALEPLPMAALLALWVREPAAREALRRFRAFDSSLDMDGYDLQAEGFAPSPGFGPALAAARRVKLDEGGGRGAQLAAAKAVLLQWQDEHG